MGLLEETDLAAHLTLRGKRRATGILDRRVECPPFFRSL
jgi:hypothetical protein